MKRFLHYNILFVFTTLVFSFGVDAKNLTCFSCLGRCLLNYDFGLFTHPKDLCFWLNRTDGSVFKGSTNYRYSFDDKNVDYCEIQKEVDLAYMDQCYTCNSNYCNFGSVPLDPKPILKQGPRIYCHTCMAFTGVQCYMTSRCGAGDHCYEQVLLGEKGAGCAIYDHLNMAVVLEMEYCELRKQMFPDLAHCRTCNAVKCNDFSTFKNSGDFYRPANNTFIIIIFWLIHQMPD